MDKDVFFSVSLSLSPSCSLCGSGYCTVLLFPPLRRSPFLSGAILTDQKGQGVSQLVMGGEDFISPPAPLSLDLPQSVAQSLNQSVLHHLHHTKKLARQ